MYQPTPDSPCCMHKRSISYSRPYPTFFVHYALPFVFTILGNTKDLKSVIIFQRRHISHCNLSYLVAPMR